MCNYYLPNIPVKYVKEVSILKTYLSIIARKGNFCG